MDLVLVSAVADSAAALGVIGSLLFVAYSVRQNSRGQRFASVQSQTASFQGAISQLIQTPDMAEVTWQGMQDRNKLEGAARLRFDVSVNIVFRAGQSVYWEWEQGGIDDKLFASVDKGLMQLAVSSGVRAVWADRRENYTSDFRSHFDSLIAQIE